MSAALGDGMAVSTGIVTHSYFPGAAMSGQGIPFQFLDAEDILVSVIGDEDLLIAGTDFVITGDGRTKAGVIRTLRAFEDDEEILLLRSTAMKQEAVTDPFKPLPAEVMGRELDRRALIEQELGEQLGRALTLPLTDDVTGKIPVPLPDRTWGFVDVPEGGVAETKITFTAGPGQTVFYLGTESELPVKVKRNGAEQIDAAFGVAGPFLTLVNCNEGDIVEATFAERTILPGVSPSKVMGVASHIPSDPATMTLLDMVSLTAHIEQWRGIDLTGVEDCTAQFQKALDEATAAGRTLLIPAGKIRLTAPIDLPDGSVLCGMSGAYQAGSKTAITTLYFDHEGDGLISADPSGSQSVIGIGFLRNQPEPGPGWAPNDHGFDIMVTGDTDFFGDDLLFINSSRGISFSNGGGRHILTNIRGQPFIVGIDLEYSADVTRLSMIHFWDFWSNSVHVYNWMLANATAIWSKRNDNADMFSLFSIFYRHGFRIGNWAGGGAGTTKRLRVFGFGADACGSAVTVDDDANGCTAEFHGLYGHGNDSIVTDGSLIDVNGTNGDLRIYGKTDLSNAHHNAVRLVGTGQSVTINDLSVNGFNLANGGHAALWVDPAAYGLTLRGEKSIAGGLYGAARFAGGGKVRGIWIAYMPTISAGGGSLSTPSASNVQYLIEDNLCRIKGEATPGPGGSGDVRTTLPQPCSATGNRIGIIKTTTGAKSGTIQPLASSSLAVMNLYDGSYPGDAGTIYFDLEYEING
ncbi:hypothetical protein [Sphingobium yanoikuyae]|uniref:hypothetical protein n=1 Tax=Sphingobium yanoikuyae TaxID=13690 RepID=UPI0035B424A1